MKLFRLCIALDTWNQFMTPYLSTYSPAMGAVVGGEVVFNALRVAYLGAVVVLFWKKRRRFVTHMTGFYAFGLAGGILDVCVVHLLKPDTPPSDGAVTALVSALLGACVWIPYLRLSRRARATFVL